MEIKAKVVNPKDVVVTFDISMTVADWEKINKTLERYESYYSGPQSEPFITFCKEIGGTIEKINNYLPL